MSTDLRGHVPSSLRVVFGLNSIIVAILAVISTYVCVQNGWFVNYPLTIIGIAVVFPIVFTIGSAYKRREAALVQYGSVKAHARALYYASRDWVGDSEAKSQAHREKLKSIFKSILVSSKKLLQATDKQRNEQAVYSHFSSLSQSVEDLRKRGLSNGECSRCNQFVSKMIVAFENMKHISQYRTPITLRIYSRVFTYVLPVLYGPYFAHLSQDASHGALTYLMPFLFAIILVSLANIQSNLEDPFDEVGKDDVRINAEKFVKNLDA